MGFKFCPSCGKTLSYIKFGINRSRPDGMQPYCKICMKKARRKSSKTEKSKESARLRQKRYREKLKEKVNKKENTKTLDSVIFSRRKQQPTKNPERSKILLNPKPVKKNGD